MKLVEFTTPDGNRVMIAPDQVVSIRTAGFSDGKNANAVIVLVNGFQAVRESLNTVVGALA